MLFKVLVRMDIEVKFIENSQLPIPFEGWRGGVEGHPGGKINLLMMTENGI